MWLNYYKSNIFAVRAFQILCTEMLINIDD